MAPHPISIPSTLKLAQLKSLAFKCGISTSGTKPILTSRIQDALLLPRSAPAKALRVLSIDMGIRNLAYCVLDVVPSPAASRSLRDAESLPKTPSVHAWQRLAVSSAPTAPSPPPSSSSPPSSTDEEGMPSPKGRSKSIPKEAFDPATLSRTAYTLLTTLLLPFHPTHILIERQRFRSMGSKHILEWTVRVNMFESILHAVLCTLRAEGRWEGEVQAIVPGKVGPFWLGEEVDGDELDGGLVVGSMAKVRRSKSAKVRSKGRKMDLVRGWLERGEMVEMGNEQAQKTAMAYREKWDRSPGGKKKKVLQSAETEEKMGKLDDLADCLLQGLAWVQWEDNKEVARKHGVEALLGI